MNYCQEMVNRYLAFYSPIQKREGGYSSTGCVKPLKLAIDVLMSHTQSSDEEMQTMISAMLAKLMSQIRTGSAEGRWVVSGESQIEAIEEFTRFFIEEFWQKAVNRDRARLSGNKAAVFEHTCEFLVKKEMYSRRKLTTNQSHQKGD